MNSHLLLRNKQLITKLVGPLYLLRVPSLSPTMKYAQVTKYYPQTYGELIPQYSLIADILCNSLLNNEENNTEMEIEIQDELYFVQNLEPTNKQLDINTPLVILTEEERDLEIIKHLNFHNDKGVVDFQSLFPPDFKVRDVLWQAYVKKKIGGISCS